MSILYPPIVGVNWTDLINYPGEVCTTLYTKGCNLCCSYCYNYKLVTEDEMDVDYILSEIHDRAVKGFISGVCITGGEPTIHDGLLKLCKEIKDMNLKVKVDTNGIRYPDVLALVDSGYVDYIAMDIKVYPIDSDEYILSDTTRRLLQLQGNVKYEFRTTVHPYISKGDLQDIAKKMNGSMAFYLQQFVPNNCADEHYRTLVPYTLDTLEDFSKLFQCDKVEVRY